MGTVPPEKWDRVCLLLDTLADLSPEQREHRLESHSGEDPEVIEQVRLLLRNMSGAAGFLSRPIGATSQILDMQRPRLQIGQVIDGRFEVRRFLGAGGMGEVYAVFDRKLKDEVALKTVRREWASVPRITERFYKEVQVARRVTHEHVCRIFDLGQEASGDAPIVYLTMQWLGGGSLRSRMRDGPLPRETAERWIRQVAEGLAAAHRAHVLHQDLKPENILIRDTTPPSAVITDFGLAVEQLAAAPGATPSTSSTFQLAGTPLYMAPERLEGHPATPAADVYALGLVMYETFTGQLPFSDRSFLGAVVLRSKSRPKLTPGTRIDPRWERVILRCLEPDPSRRYRSAVEVLEDLDDRRRVTRRAWLVAGSMAGVALLANGFRFLKWDPIRWPVWSGAKPSGDRILLTPWEVAGGSELHSLDIAMAKALEQSGRVSFWDHQGLPAVLARMGRKPDAPLTPADWREVALREKVPLVLFISAAPVGDGCTLALRLEQVSPSTPRTAGRGWQKSFDAQNRAGLMDALHDAARWVREMAGESAADIAAADRPPQDITTSSWDALVAFARGERLAEKDESAALLEYDVAIRYDPGFTMAWTRKGDLLLGAERETDALLAWKTAIDLSPRRPLTVREDLRLRATFADDTGDYRTSEKLFAEYARRFPNEPWGYFSRETPLTMLGLTDEAIAMLNECKRFPERNAGTYLRLAWIYLSRGLYDRAAEQIRVLRSEGREDRALWAEACVFYAQRNRGAALDRLREATPLTTGALRSRMRQREISVLADAGRQEEAMRLARDGATQDLADGFRTNAAFKLASAAYLELQRPDKMEAARLAQRASEVDEGPSLLAQAGTVLARAGRPDLASRTLHRLDGALNVPRFQVARNRIIGEVALATGKRGEAIRALRTAADQDLQPFGHAYLARGLAMAGDRAAAAAEYAAAAKVRYFELKLLYPELPGITREAEQFHL